MNNINDILAWTGVDLNKPLEYEAPEIEAIAASVQAEVKPQSETKAVNGVYQVPQDALDIALEFIEGLTWDKDSKMTFCCFHEKDKNVKDNPSGIFYGSLTEHYQSLRDFNSRGYAVYVTVQETFSLARKREDIGQTRALFVEIDKGGLPKEFHILPSIIVESSPGKYHVYWCLKKLVKLTDDEFKEAVIPLIVHYKAGKESKDLARVLRLPGFNHYKNEPVQVKIIDLSYEGYSLDEIKITETKKQEPKKLIEAQPVTNKESSEYINKLHSVATKKIEHLKKIAKGKRHHTLNKYCHYLGGLLVNYPLIFDFYQAKTHEVVRELESAGVWEADDSSHQTIDDAFESGKQSPVQLDAIDKPSDHAILKEKVLSWLEDFGSIRWNKMKLRIEIDGAEVETNSLRQNFMQDMNYDCGKESFTDLIVFIAKENSYHPVVEYLDSLEMPDDMEPDEYIDCILGEVYTAMHLDDKPPIQKIMLKKWLIGCVARIYDPGCKLDNVLVLKSPQQGLNKTSFFETLFGEFFQTAGNHKSEADELLALQQAWVSEWGEIEATFDKKGIAALKAFLTKLYDIFRAPYASAPTTVLRQFAFCGTTNEDQFLSDATGNRRYWVVDISKKINLAVIDTFRDEIFAVIKYLYKQGILGKKANGKPEYTDFLWWMDDDQELLVAENVANSEQIDSIEDSVLNILKQKEYVTAQEIYSKLVSIAIELPQGRPTDMRIAHILKRNGIGKARQIRLDGSKARYYRWDAYWDKKSVDDAQARSDYLEAQAAREAEAAQRTAGDNQTGTIAF